MGFPKVDDLKMINQRVIDNLLHEELPKNLRYGTYYNKPRDSIHASLFEKMILQSEDTDGFVIVISDNLESRPSKSGRQYEPYTNPKRFYETIGESDCNCGQSQGRFDPVLKLYYGCELMNTMNADVRKGKANGTQYVLQRIKLKHGEQPSTTLIANKRIKLLRASQVDHIVCQTKGKNPKVHKIEPVNRSYKIQCSGPIQLSLSRNSRPERRFFDMKSTQLPVVSNNATTGFKLQGSSVPSLIVKEWNRKKNWTYVMLSRVCERKGLFLESPISENPADYLLSVAHGTMLADFQEVACPPLNIGHLELTSEEQQVLNSLETS